MTEAKPLPNSVEIENSLLVALLVDSRGSADAFDQVSPEDFYSKPNRLIFDACRTLHEKGTTVDLPTVVEELQSSGKLGEIGGAYHIARITDENPAAIDVEHACRIIREQSILRDLIDKAYQTIRSCHAANGNVVQIIDQTQRAFFSVGNPGESSFISMRELQHQSIDRYERLCNGKQAPTLLTGFSELDTITGGLSGAKFIILAARTRIGKTAMMLCMARNMAINNFMVGIFSIEMEASELDDRFMAMESGINTLRLTTGKGPNKEDWPKIMVAASRKSQWPILIDETGGLSVMELSRRARQMKKAGCQIIFIDQFSKIKPDSRKSRFEAKSEIVEALGDLKKELRIPIVLLAQINRNVEARGIKKPTLGDLKDTGQLEEEADIVLLLDRPEIYDPRPENKDMAILEIAKHRGGPCIEIKLQWAPKRTLFHDI